MAARSDAMIVIGDRRSSNPKRLAELCRALCPRVVAVAGAEELDPSRPIGCASARRAVQLKELFPDMETAPVRGNVLTRLRKLDAEKAGK